MPLISITTRVKGFKQTDKEWELETIGLKERS